MSLITYNLLQNLKRFWRKNVKNVYIDLGASHPFLYLNSGGLSNGL